MEPLLSRISTAIKTAPLTKTTLLLAPPTLLAVLYTYSYYGVSSLSYACTIPTTFRTSASIRTVNPRSYSQLEDTVSAPVPRSWDGTSDRELLTRFSQGFWGGRVFRLERLVLTRVGRRMCGFTGAPATEDIYTIPSSLPQVGITLFGAFQILDVGEKHVDFGFGRSEQRFAGCHRFEVVNGEGEKEGGRYIRVAHLSCNPTEDGGLLGGWAGSWVMGFHGMYARLLFGDGMRALERAV